MKKASKQALPSEEEDVNTKRLRKLEALVHRLIVMTATPEWVETTEKDKLLRFMKHTLITNPMMSIKLMKVELRKWRGLEQYQPCVHIWSKVATNCHRKMGKRISTWRCTQGLNLLVKKYNQGVKFSNNDLNAESLKPFEYLLKRENQLQLFEDTRILLRQAFKSGDPSNEAIRFFLKELWMSLWNRLYPNDKKKVYSYPNLLETLEKNIGNLEGDQGDDQEEDQSDDQEEAQGDGEEGGQGDSEEGDQGDDQEGAQGDGEEGGQGDDQEGAQAQEGKDVDSSDQDEGDNEGEAEIAASETVDVIGAYAFFDPPPTKKPRVDALPPTTSDNENKEGDYEGSSNNEVRSGDTAAKSLEEFLRGLLLTHGVCNLAFLKQQFYEQQESDSALTTETIHNLFRAVLAKIAYPVQNAYVLQSVGNPDLDTYRNEIIQIFRERLSITETIVQEKLGAMTKSNREKVMKELAFRKKRIWIFKSGNGHENNDADAVGSLDSAQTSYPAKRAGDDLGSQDLAQTQSLPKPTPKPIIQFNAPQSQQPRKKKSKAKPQPTIQFNARSQQPTNPKTKTKTNTKGTTRNANKRTSNGHNNTSKGKKGKKRTRPPT